LFSAFRQLFPAERMVIMGGRPCRGTIRVTSVIDVTEARPSVAHVRADRGLLANALVDLSRSGAHLSIWMHSHPGTGTAATFPSSIDLTQEEDLLRHYSNRLVCLIAVQDGFVRVWGRAIDDGSVTLRWQGRGIASHRGEPHVYQLQLR
jgi:proteasome lid subunit RPN8/RPN11